VINNNSNTNAVFWLIFDSIYATGYAISKHIAVTNKLTNTLIKRVLIFALFVKNSAKLYNDKLPSAEVNAYYNIINNGIITNIVKNKPYGIQRFFLEKENLFGFTVVKLSKLSLEITCACFFIVCFPPLMKV
jgi:hypothetical protein